MYSKNVRLDKFYTKDEVAKMCLAEIDINEFDMVIEPSAGSGSFTLNMKHDNMFSFDLEPECDCIIKENWFDVTALNGDKVLVIGNPPFGRNNMLSKDFIRHAIKLGAHTIAFILPDVFSKVSNQSKSIFPLSWRLVKEIKLPRDSFTANGEPYHVPCSFYIWTKEEGSINLRKKKLSVKNDDFEFVKRESPEAEFSVNGNNGKVKEISEITNPKAEHYIKSKDMNVEELKDMFRSFDYNFKSSVNGGNSWVGRNELMEEYIKYKATR